MVEEIIKFIEMIFVIFAWIFSLLLLFFVGREYPNEISIGQVISCFIYSSIMTKLMWMQVGEMFDRK